MDKTITNMSDILKEGAELKAFKLSDDDVKYILEAVEKKQSEIRRLKKIKYDDLNKIITI